MSDECVGPVDAQKACLADDRLAAARLDHHSDLVRLRYTLEDGAIIPTDHVPHEFVGRLDRWCEVCGLPDRHPIHREVAA